LRCIADGRFVSFYQQSLNFFKSAALSLRNCRVDPDDGNDAPVVQSLDRRGVQGSVITQQSGFALMGGRGMTHTTANIQNSEKGPTRVAVLPRVAMYGVYLTTMKELQRSVTTEFK
jgi:hypothetical protein